MLDSPTREAPADQVGHEAIADRLNAIAASLTLGERLLAIADAVKDRIVLTTSFGIEDQAITHAIASAGIETIELVTLDTGRLFPETYALWAETQNRYGLPIKPFFPSSAGLEKLIAADGPDGFYRSIETRKNCCHIRKVEPLARALAGAKGWITGLRGDQSEARATVAFAHYDPERGMIKFNPLFDWTRDRVADFTRAANVPINPLHAEGFVSIGCAPCTRAIRPGEPERAGRWWWEDEANKECGLHVNAEGKLVRGPAPGSKTEARKELFL
ncbi:MAG: phosphoadenylyl-sulfate reductase [Beijerinckiaceae bacterium]|nr:phosphoadenylyl-sulfate reductase [Beijerinckiaceae bacterium]